VSPAASPTLQMPRWRVDLQWSAVPAGRFRCTSLLLRGAVLIQFVWVYVCRVMGGIHVLGSPLRRSGTRGVNGVRKENKRSRLGLVCDTGVSLPYRVLCNEVSLLPPFISSLLPSDLQVGHELAPVALR